MNIASYRLALVCIALALAQPMESFAGILGLSKSPSAKHRLAASDFAVVSDLGPPVEEDLPPTIGAGQPLPILSPDSCTQCGGDSAGGAAGGYCNRCAPCGLFSGWGGFFEFTYLRPRDTDVAYAVAIDGPIAAPPLSNPIQVGRVGVVDPDYQPGFRAGVSVPLEATRRFMASYASLETSTTDRIGTSAPDVIRSLVSHPSSLSAATDFLQASAQYDVDFDLVDADLRGRWLCGCNYELGYFLGGRYARLMQDFQANFVDTGMEIVRTGVDFEGGGIRFGLDGRRNCGARRCYVFATGGASFVAGEFRARHFQGQSFDPTVVDTSWEAGRVVTILETEAGVAWQSASGRLHASVGYAFSAWLNAVKTERFIQAVQNNSFLALDDTLSFDGLTSRLEWRY